MFLLVDHDSDLQKQVYILSLEGDKAGTVVTAKGHTHRDTDTSAAGHSAKVLLATDPASALGLCACSLRAQRAAATERLHVTSLLSVKVRPRLNKGLNHCLENLASRGTETSAEFFVGPPWRMESNAGQQQWY